MANEDRTPDFDDLLAAFDIPDVPSIHSNKEPDNTSHFPVAVRASPDTALVHRFGSENSDKNHHIDDKKTKLLPTSKLTLGPAPNKRGGSKNLLYNSNLTNVAPSKKIPSLANRQTDEKMQVITTNSLPLNSGTTLMAVNATTVVPSESPTLPQDLAASDDTTYQLSTNVLPPYVPMILPPEKFKLNIPPEGYRCTECGDRFLLESSLAQHERRRSVRITFDCETCKKTVIYYNRCNLLGHIRGHREKNEPADIKKADVTPLPREHMNTVQPPLASTLHLNGNASQSPSSPLPSPTAAMANVATPSKLALKVGVENADGKFRCSECSQLFESAHNLEEHFGRSQNMPLATSQCAKCNMTCPSKCSLASHQRIHLQSKPFICPECGQNVSDNWAAFQHHLSVKCLHYSRTIGYKCSICYTLFSNGELLGQHIISVHSEAYYKCQACPMAFKAGNTFDAHKKTAHMTMDVQCATIFKCPLCDVVFNSGEQLHDHLDVHIKEQIKATKFVFKCLVCQKLVDNKVSLCEHLNEVHLHIITREVCVHCGMLFDNKGLADQHVAAKHAASNSNNANQRVRRSASPPNDHQHPPKAPSHQGLTKCEVCSRVFQTGHGYNIHKQRCHSNSAALTCFVCGEKCPSRSEMVLHGRHHQQDGLIICMVCNNHTFESRTGLAKHLDTHATNMKLPAKCFHCNEVMEDSTSASKHLKMEHGFSSYACDKCDMQYYTMKSLVRHDRVMHSSDGSRRKYVCWICKERDFGKRVLLEKHITITHKIPSKDIDFSKMLKASRPPIKIKIPRPLYMAAVKQEEQLHHNDYQQTDQPRGDYRQDDSIPLKKLRNCEVGDGVIGGSCYTCCKCDYVTDTKSTFIEHIVEHKTDNSSLQCRECGSCFVVEPSLKKHLVIVHKVRNVEQYLIDEGINALHGGDDLTSGGDGGGGGHSSSNNPLECTVCFHAFPTDLALKNHTRTHGMAFIRSRRLVNTSESSPASSS